MEAPHMIVAEVNKNWRDGRPLTPGPLCQEFEKVINVNRQRGYRLHSFVLHQLRGPGTIMETIIAVFEKEPPPPTEEFDPDATVVTKEDQMKLEKRLQSLAAHLRKS